MAEEAELQAKIAAISGKIDQRRHYPATLATPNQHYSSSYHGYSRWAPYGRGQPVHKNRTLVLRNTTTTRSDPKPVAPTPLVPAKEPFVTRGGHQLMNQETYNRERSKQQELNDNKRAVKRQKMDTTTARELEIEGIRFRVQNDGGKLMRVTGDDVPADVAGRETPKTITISGIVFLRTKHGNLVRDNQKARTTQRSAKPQCEHFTKHGTVSNPPTMAGCSTSRRRLDCQLAGKNPNLLLTLTTGTCPFGPRCKFSHDPNKVAICKHFLKAGSCPNGDLCDMSHEMTYHRVPACTYFIRGNCTNSACRYPHVHVSPAASVCRPFATLGFCAKGPDCDKRHVVECPDYANRGFCANRENGKCLLPHPDRASTMRKAAERQAKLASGGESDVSSDEEQFIIDVDSDVAEDLTGSDEDRHELTQQQDFVAFS